MWQVWHACGDLASCREKVWRVWHESQEAVPKRSCFCNTASCSGDLIPILWQEPQPFMPSVMGITAFAASVAVVWAEPWQVSHSIPTSWCLLCFQSETTLGVTVLWQAT